MPKKRARRLRRLPVDEMVVRWSPTRVALYTPGSSRYSSMGSSHEPWLRSTDPLGSSASGGTVLWVKARSEPIS